MLLEAYEWHLNYTRAFTKNNDNKNEKEKERERDAFFRKTQIVESFEEGRTLILHFTFSTISRFRSSRIFEGKKTKK